MSEDRMESARVGNPPELTRILVPWFGDVKLWRDVSRRNQAVGRIGFLIASSERWLPRILTDAGFFPSNNECKKNRPDLWREPVDGEVIKLGFAMIRVALVSGFIDVSPSI